MNYTFCSRTHPGRVRDNNEDSVLVDEATQLAVLADGMGGYNAGEIASAMATSLIQGELSRSLSAADAQTSIAVISRAVEACVTHANHAIFIASRTNAHYMGMGTTLVLAVFRDQRLLVGHIGDSRCYRLRGDTLQQITKDHSLLQEQLDAGWLTPAQAIKSPIRNLVTRAMGVDSQVLLEIHEHEVVTGDLYLLCSDGLSDMVEDDVMAEVLRRDAPLPQMADELVARANANGGRDNITVVLARASGQPEKPRLISRWLGKQ
jgi:PPM family protein phosphatase